MNKSEMKAALVCLVAFLLGCVIAFTGCSFSGATRSQMGRSSIQTGIKVECCSCCGFIPWSDSWCEKHYGR